MLFGLERFNPLHCRVQGRSVVVSSKRRFTTPCTGGESIFKGRVKACLNKQILNQGTHPSAPAPSSETSVATLVSMGFDSNSARQALIHAGNDINVATNIVLESQSR